MVTTKTRPHWVVGIKWESLADTFSPGWHIKRGILLAYVLFNLQPLHERKKRKKDVIWTHFSAIFSNTLISLTTFNIKGVEMSKGFGVYKMCCSISILILFLTENDVGPVFYQWLSEVSANQTWHYDYRWNIFSHWLRPGWYGSISDLGYE